MLENNERIIWSSEVNLNDWLQDREDVMDGELRCDTCSEKDCKECDLFYSSVMELNNLYLYDEIENLNMELPNKVVAFADLGLWNGRRKGYKVLDTNLNSIFNVSADSNVYYADRYNVRARCTHHDGTNLILYRMVKPNVDVENLENYLLRHKYDIAPNQLSRFTQSLLPYVKEIYGW